MAGYKETPRQKMIAMMYLVLTALLALNVSKDILESFVLVNDSIVTTSETFKKKIDESYDEFKQAYLLNKNKVGPYWEDAEKVRELTKEMVDYIENVKAEVIAKTDRIPLEQARKLSLHDVKSKDNYDVPTEYFIGQSQDGSAGEALPLKNRLIKYKKDVLYLVYKHTGKDKFEIDFNTKGPFQDADGKKQNWEVHNFYRTILAADVTILNKLIAAVRNVEFDVVSELMSSITAEDFKFDEIRAKIIPKTNYVIKGDNYEAEVLVAAYDTKQAPEVLVVRGTESVNSQNLKFATPLKGDSGMVKLKFPTTTEGIQKYAGVIRVRDPQGSIEEYPFKGEYVVAAPSAVVSADKMNVFYIGVDNPVTISVPGFADTKIKPSITGGTLKHQGGNHYIVDVSRDSKKAVIDVFVEQDRKMRSMGQTTFRVKRVPDPIAYVANQKEGNVSKEALITAGAIIPKMPEEFDFDLSFTIVSFKMVTVKSGDVRDADGVGNRLNEKMISYIREATRGQRIWFEDIIAKGPDGNRKLSPVVLKIQ